MYGTNQDALIFSENVLLLNNIRIISAEPVNTLDNKSVFRLYLFYKVLTGGTIEIFAREFIDENVLTLDAKLSNGDDLSILRTKKNRLEIMVGTK